MSLTSSTPARLGLLALLVAALFAAALLVGRAGNSSSTFPSGPVSFQLSTGSPAIAAAPAASALPKMRHPPAPKPKPTTTAAPAPSAPVASSPVVSPPASAPVVPVTPAPSTPAPSSGGGGGTVIISK
jgi:hypothetical protein